VGIAGTGRRHGGSETPIHRAASGRRGLHPQHLPG
jgi:hypothetical protein